MDNQETTHENQENNVLSPTTPTLEQMVNTLEKPVFIASKEPELINKLNDFLRTFGNENESYKLLVISEDISEKLFEQYHFSKLATIEQEAIRKQKMDEQWQQEAHKTALFVHEALRQAGYEKTNFRFLVSNLKEALRASKRKLNTTQLKGLLDVLISFGYIIKVNDESAFNKMKFQLLMDTDFKLEILRVEQERIVDQIQQFNEKLYALYAQEKELLEQQSEATATDEQPADTNNAEQS